MVYKATCKLSSSALTAPSKAQTATHGNVIGRMGQNALRVCNAADNGLGRTTKSASIVLTAPLKAQTAIHGNVTGRMGKTLCMFAMLPTMVWQGLPTSGGQGSTL